MMDNWSTLTHTEQQAYYDHAEFLIDNCYVDTEDDPWVFAEKIYNERKHKEELDEVRANNG